MRYVSLELDNALNPIIEKWANSLEANHDDYVVVDGEEGDFGIVRYFGFDLHGNADVHLMTRYVEGGDLESVYYTEAGAEMVEHLVRRNLERVVKTQLRESIDTVGFVGGMHVGFVQHYKDAEAEMEKQGKTVVAVLHTGEMMESLNPDEFVNRGIYKYNYKLFEALVAPAKGAMPEMVGFRNLIRPNEFLAYPVGDVAHYMNTAETWKGILANNTQMVVENNRPEYASTLKFPTFGPISKVLHS